MYLQRRIAKKLQAVVGGKIEEKLFFGTIDKAIHKTTKSKLKKRRLKHAPPDRWHVTFDAMDGDEEEKEDGDHHFDEVLNEMEVHNALELYAKHCKQDPHGIDETSLLLANQYHQQQKYMSKGAGFGGGINTRPMSSLALDASEHSSGESVHGHPPTDIPVSWPYQSKHKKPPLNKAAVAFILFFLFAARSIASVANQHGNMTQFWIIPVGDSSSSSSWSGSTTFDQSSAVRLDKNSDVAQHAKHAQHTRDAQLSASFHANNDHHHQQQQSFSACLLWMDDNHRLPEWFAYHYFALPLRHVILAVDPHSSTQVSISSHWQNKMHITIWQDSDYTVTDLTRKPGDTKNDLKGKHRQRQSQFYQACCRHLKNLNRTYTTFHDSDEYLTISEEYYVKQQQKQKQKRQSQSQKYIHHASAEFRRQPGHILTLLNEYNDDKKQNKKKKKKKETTTTTTDTPHEDLAQTCIHVPRALYSAVESQTEKRNKGVPDWLLQDANHQDKYQYQLDTLRYRHRLTERGGRDGLGKAIIDVSRLTKEDIDEGGTTHRPLKEVCAAETPWRDYGSFPLGIHHYLGSWESYSFRDDARKGTLRRRDIWLSRAESEQGGSDDEIREWIAGFTKATGDDLARELLSGAGLSRSDIDEKNASNHWQSGWE
ncbi:unnamed protein product [Cylindrotheca closterium]|uniref:Uncharacterized protein n=1 Tax=Cylindrotheca closterium TaxID=2856 RepID=A0AAD2FZF6_9STRA|nr:unnamed protein product [Cylindrotheca closterium]